MAPRPLPQSWSSPSPSTTVHYNGTLQWHPAMAPRPLPQSWSSPSPSTTVHYNGTLRWHPSNGTTSTAPCNGTLVPRPIRQSGSSPSPLLEVRTPIAIAIWGKKGDPSRYPADFLLGSVDDHSMFWSSNLWVKTVKGMYLTCLENGPRRWQSNKTPAGGGAWRGVKNRLHMLLHYAKLMISPSREKKKLRYVPSTWLARDWSPFSGAFAVSFREGTWILYRHPQQIHPLRPYLDSLVGTSNSLHLPVDRLELCGFWGRATHRQRGKGVFFSNEDNWVILQK